MVIVTDKKVHSVLVDDDEYHKIQSITPSTGKYKYPYFFIEGNVSESMSSIWCILLV